MSVLMVPHPDRVAAAATDPALAPVRRSLEFYYSQPHREKAMDALYSQFLGPDDLAFDVGSHVGDRIGSFRRLGARVVALEPQPVCVRALRHLYGDDDAVTVLAAACGDAPGTVTMHINSANPTVSTAAAGFVRAAAGAGGWEGQVWDGELTVPSTTLEALIADHGRPRFVKVDVEGFEDRVLAGLHQPLPALSFEFTTIAREVAFRCLEQLASHGEYGFDLSLGESQELTFHRWVGADELAAHLERLPHEANAGDVYCVLERER